MKPLLTVVFLWFLAMQASAQTGGIEGVVKDEKGELLLSASIQVTEGGIVKGKGITDLDGCYLIKLLNAGRYDVKVSLPGYVTELIQDVLVVDAQNTTLNFTMTRPNHNAIKSHSLREVVILAPRYTKPLIEPVELGRHCTGNISEKEIEPMASHSEAEEQTLNLEQVQLRKLPEKRSIEWTDPGSRSVLFGSE